MYIEFLMAVVCLGQVQQTFIPTSAPGNTASESIEVRYARAQMQLAEVNLKRVERSNERVAGAVPSSVVAEYQHDVQVAKTRLEQATAARPSSEFQIWLQRAAAEQNAAETMWANALAVNRRVKGTFGPLELQRYQLRAEVAKLQLERGQTLIDAGREAQLQWQIEVLDNQVQRLKEESRRPTSSAVYYPYCWW